MKKIAALIALAGLAAAANAGPGKIDILVRNVTQGGAAANSVGGAAGDTIEVQVWYAWGNPTSGTAVGLSTVIHNLTSSSFDASNTMFDTGDYRAGRFNFGAQTQKAFRSGNNLRIADIANDGDVAAGGISVKQASPSASGASFDANNPALGYTFTFVIGAGQGTDISFDAPLDRINSYRVYTNATNTTGSPASITFDATDGATVVIPAPASLALLGLGGLVAGRRRR
ncbi:MAG: PEP-CTERM sorting domain-containing protein [Phycisphaerales bacterium]|jgi:MYXO-CTERM domain-containing protein|nr:PEP-CTERM sorting domain-containing protein [Phycisphaerales bacterium]